MNDSKRISSVEKKCLLNLVEKYEHIIENKGSDNKSIREKKQAWIALTEEFNANPDCNKRSVNHLRLSWNNIKFVKRRQLLDQEVERIVAKRRISGGTSLLPEDLELDVDHLSKPDDAIEFEEKKRTYFTEYEREYLEELALKYFHTPATKPSVPVSFKEKRMKWYLLSEEFNSNSECTKKTTEQLRICWKNLKKKRKMENRDSSFQDTSTASEDMLDSLIKTEIEETMTEEPENACTNDDIFVQEDCTAEAHVSNLENHNEELQKRLSLLQAREANEAELHQLRKKEIELKIKTAELMHQRAELELERAREELERAKEERKFSAQKQQEEIDFKRSMYQIPTIKIENP